MLSGRALARDRGEKKHRVCRSRSGGDDAGSRTRAGTKDRDDSPRSPRRLPNGCARNRTTKRVGVAPPCAPLQTRVLRGSRYLHGERSPTTSRGPKNETAPGSARRRPGREPRDPPADQTTQPQRWTTRIASLGRTQPAAKRGGTRSRYRTPSLLKLTAAAPSEEPSAALERLRKHTFCQQQ